MEQMQAIAERIGTLLALRKDGSISLEQEDILIAWLEEQDSFTQEFIEDFTQILNFEDDLDKFCAIDADAALADVMKRIIPGLS